MSRKTRRNKAPKVPTYRSVRDRGPLLGGLAGAFLLPALSKSRRFADRTLGMDKSEKRGTERVLLPIPIRVIAFGSDHGGFSEETCTIEVNQAGARISLKHRVTAGDTLRIINLENFCEADFRVVGPIRLDKGEVGESGVECSEAGRNIWNIEFPNPLPPADSRAGALLRCEGCGKEVLSVLTLMEVDILDASGSLQRLCDQCGHLAVWTYSSVLRSPKEVPTAVPAPVPVAVPVAASAPIALDAPPLQAATPTPGQKGIELRAHKRLPLKLPVLVRTFKGQEEVARSEDISKGGLAVVLGMLLAVGEIVKVVCPYTRGEQSLEQKAEVRRRQIFVAGGRWLYGMRYVR